MNYRRSSKEALASMSELPSQGLRTYYLLVATQTVSQVGSRISFFAVGISVFIQTSHATPIARWPRRAAWTKRDPAGSRWVHWPACR